MICYFYLLYSLYSFFNIEKHLPAEEKTIKPKNLGGLAGGEKYDVLLYFVLT